MVKNQSLILDRVFQALAHPARRSMLRRLAQGERNLTELAEPLKMSFPAVSKHVRVLERAKLVRRRIEGRTHWCRIEPQPLAEASGWLDEWRRNWEANFERLDGVLEELTNQAKKS
jgi:DNA-binding transcriptional ArsR family regulator